MWAVFLSPLKLQGHFMVIQSIYDFSEKNIFNTLHIAVIIIPFQLNFESCSLWQSLQESFLGMLKFKIKKKIY